MRPQRLLRGAVVSLLVRLGVASLASLPPLDDPLAPEEAEGPLRVAALVGVALYALAAVRYRTLYGARMTGAALPLAILTAWVLLAEAMIAIAYGRNWQLSWWEWHVLMAIAFASSRRSHGSSSAAPPRRTVRLALPRADDRAGERRVRGALGQLVERARGPRTSRSASV